MQKIKNLGEVIKQLRPLLPQYLEDSELNFLSKKDNFQCPNYRNHDKTSDDKPSCGFLPDNTYEKFHCFSCGAVGTIFDAVHLLEDKEVTGLSFYKIVTYLADKYKVAYETEEPTEEEKQFDTVQNFLLKIIESGNKYLMEKKPKKALTYLKKRDWIKCVKKFQLGYLPKGKQTKQFFISAFKKHPELKNLIHISDEQVVDRLIIPVRSKHGTIIGIIHRALSKEDKREKYMKHFITGAAEKGVVFNLKDAHSKLYIVEGASSVLTLYAKGIKNVVAILGTAFNEYKYKRLLRNRVSEIIFCLDGDSAGQQGLQKAIKVVEDKPDLRVYVKVLPEDKDPDDVVIEGVDKFKKIAEDSLFKYQVNRLKENDVPEIRQSIYKLILATSDSILRDRMIKFFTRELKTQKSALLNELKKYESKTTLPSDITIAEIELERESLKGELEKFEERAWRTDRLLGITTGFPILDDKLDGLQDGLHEVGGIWNIGKSAFLLSLALNVLKNSDSTHVLYFTLDDPIQTKTLPRAVANLSCIPINVAANPYWRIQKNETLKEIERVELAEKREAALKLLGEISSRFSLKDSSHGYQLDFVEKMIKIQKIIAGDKKLVVFIDFLHMISVGKAYIDSIEALTKIAQQLKHLAGLYNIPIVTTVEGTKAIGSTDMKDKHIKGSVSLQFGADTIIILTSDFYDNPKSEMYFTDDEGNAKPVVKVTVSKNKISGFKGALYYKFYPEISKFEECSEEDQKKYRRGY